MKLAPADPRTSSSSGAQLASTRIVTGDTKSSLRASTAAWKAIWASDENPLYVTWNVEVWTFGKGLSNRRGGTKDFSVIPESRITNVGPGRAACSAPYAPGTAVPVMTIAVAKIMARIFSSWALVEFIETPYQEPTGEGRDSGWLGRGFPPVCRCALRLSNRPTSTPSTVDTRRDRAIYSPFARKGGSLAI